MNRDMGKRIDAALIFCASMCLGLLIARLIGTAFFGVPASLLGP